jgi:hypothetical protein
MLGWGGLLCAPPLARQQVGALCSRGGCCNRNIHSFADRNNHKGKKCDRS